MKTIKKTYFRIINKIIAIIAAFTGLQACGISIHPMYAPPAPTPLAYFSISGRVENKLQKPIRNIEVELTTPQMLNDEDVDLAVFHYDISDYSGKFYINELIDENSYRGEGEFTPPKEVALVIQDLDGEENGEFKNDTIIVPLEFKTDSTSSYPYAEVTDLVITLEEKEQNNEEENKQ